MQVSVKTTTGLERCLTIGIPKESIQPKIQERLNSLARDSKLNGFRQGKIPKRVIEERYGLKVCQEVQQELIQTSFTEALNQEKLRPISNAVFDLKTDLKDFKQGLSYTATFEIYPQISTLHTDGLNVEKIVVNITDTDVDALLERLRKQRQTWHNSEHQSINGNRLIVNIVGTINGNPFKNNNLKKIPVILGENDFIFPEFEEKLLGMGIEENREFDITFSKEHHNVEIAGQTVHFMVHVSKIETAQLPEMNEDFIRSFGVTDGRMETLRIEARKNMERELQYVNNKTIKQQILNALLQENPITEIPVSLMKAETERLLKKTSQDKYIQAVDTKNIQDTAERLIKIGLLAGEVIGKHNIKATPQKIYQMVANIAHAYENSEAVIQEYYTDQKRLKDIETSVIEDELVNWLLQRANITEKHTDFYTAVTT